MFALSRGALVRKDLALGTKLRKTLWVVKLVAATLLLMCLVLWVHSYSRFDGVAISTSAETSLEMRCSRGVVSVGRYCGNIYRISGIRFYSFDSKPLEELSRVINDMGGHYPKGAFDWEHVSVTHGPLHFSVARVFFPVWLLCVLCSLPFLPAFYRLGRRCLGRRKAEREKEKGDRLLFWF